MRGIRGSFSRATVSALQCGPANADKEKTMRHDGSGDHERRREPFRLAHLNAVEPAAALAAHASAAPAGRERNETSMPAAGPAAKRLPVAARVYLSFVFAATVAAAAAVLGRLPHTHQW